MIHFSSSDISAKYSPNYVCVFTLHAVTLLACKLREAGVRKRESETEKSRSQNEGTFLRCLSAVISQAMLLSPLMEPFSSVA